MSPLVCFSCQSSSTLQGTDPAANYSANFCLIRPLSVCLCWKSALLFSPPISRVSVTWRCMTVKHFCFSPFKIKAQLSRVLWPNGTAGMSREWCRTGSVFTLKLLNCLKWLPIRPCITVQSEDVWQIEGVFSHKVSHCFSSRQIYEFTKKVMNDCEKTKHPQDEKESSCLPHAFWQNVIWLFFNSGFLNASLP